LTAIENSTVLEPKIGFRGLFLHAWDLAEDIDRLLAWMKETGLNTLCLAANYHQGWFIHPHSRTHCAYLTEGDVAYFHPQHSLYERIRVAPSVAPLAAKTDWLAEASRRAGSEFRLVAWTIGCHNTTIGLTHPELTVRNVFGDSLPHALCPAQPEVREYLKALCRDLATNYPLWGIQLEAFGWMGFAHGHHHERNLIGLNPFELDLMGLCFCDACRAQATQAGIEIEKVKAEVQAVLLGALREAPERPRGHPCSTLDMQDKSLEYSRFCQWRDEVAHRLVNEIKTECLGDDRCRLLLQTCFDPALSKTVDGFACIAFEKSAPETLRACRDLRGSSGDWKGLLQCLIQLGNGIPGSEHELLEIISAALAGGCNGVNFYNYSEAPPKMLQWLAQTLPQFA
jgi:hypothetical protein